MVGCRHGLFGVERGRQERRGWLLRCTITQIHRRSHGSRLAGRRGGRKSMRELVGSIRDLP